MRNDTGESTRARVDAEDWRRIKPMMDLGATLVWNSKTSHYYTNFKGEYGRYGLTKTKASNLVKAGEIELVGVQTYGLVQK